MSDVLQEPAVKIRKGGAPLVCSILGVLILVSVILFCVPLSVPRLLGYEIYNVVSGSMEPALPVGSLVYVKTIAPETVAQGDIIAYQSGDSVITHRVLTNRLVEGEFVTKGDANDEADFTPVPYGSLLGRVVYHIPYLGSVLFLYTSTWGKVYVAGFAVCGVLLNLLASQLRARRREKALYQELARRQEKLRQREKNIS
jgi:signal peptidase I